MLIGGAGALQVLISPGALCLFYNNLVMFLQDDPPPVAPPVPEPLEPDDCRLWIGNMDPRITE